jgi:hypothetical protein
VPTRQEEYERIGAERLAAEREAQRDKRRALWLALLGVVASCGAGLFVMFFAFWVNDREIGMMFLWGAFAVGYGGMSYFLLSAYRRGVERGDW